MDEALRRDLLIVAVRPDYPWAARRFGQRGAGVFDLRFDFETGNLREVHVVRSAGVRALDGYAIGALKLWKAKPRSLLGLRVAIEFTRPGPDMLHQ
ncbi:MAG: energy transducer TonB [Chthoniobacterales bacterium]